ncbi:serine hydrolase domain-containing protein [Hymenobacter chitinivorans]|uniref:CubicO group peptidase (Beta-lactamase class C family) n=1 Tax=Hymenobacter chitinivorans DSM 11115 TaxID=1121954 RepID=A0A2M9BPF7_9BACT|nr:serine hydrolase domain-containing protein [Hymenobacter chitinivorans]PJJ59839.1 CubicO group peptidase (beta-lactamase class C family) [Hymenobacter chitinivorans DSM 11115]
MKHLLTLALLLCSLVATAQQAELEALLKRENVPGLQLVYTKKGETKQYSLGLRQASTAQPMDATTTMQAASLGKVVLAYTALRLHDQGRFDLDKPLLTYAPYPRLQAEPRAGRITARMVLGHTSGLPLWAEYPLADSWKTSKLTLKFAPDSCWSYSGEGYVWLQRTLEHITGKTLDQLAQQEVFGPLKMKHSSFTWQARFDQNAAFGHDEAGKPTEVKRFAEPNGGFSLLTTAANYSRFARALLRGQGLKPATARLLTTAANPATRCTTPPTATAANISWAWGLGLASTSHGPAQWHWGNNGDFRGFFMTFPQTQETLVFFTNSANGLKLVDDVLSLFVGPGQYQAMQWLAEEK